MSENPAIIWKPEINYEESSPETAGFVSSVSNAVADQFGYPTDELYIAEFRDDHSLILEYEEDGEVEGVRLEQSGNEPFTLEEYDDFLDRVGRENITDMYVRELIPNTSNTGFGIGSSWDYGSIGRPLRIWLTTEDEVFRTELDDEVEFSGMFSVVPYILDKKTVEKEPDTFTNRLKKSLGLEPYTYETTNVTKQGPRHAFEFMEQPRVAVGPHMGEVDRDRVEAVYEEAKDSPDFSLENV